MLLIMSLSIAQAELLTLHNHEDSYGFLIGLPYGHITGSLEPANNGLEASIDYLQVHDGVLRNGIGSKLLKSFFRYSLECGATRVSSIVVSPEALLMRKKIFGDETQHIFDPNQPRSTELPMSIDQAYASLKRSEAYEEECEKRGLKLPDDPGTGFEVVVLMNEIRIPEDWEIPTTPKDAPLPRVLAAEKLAP
jgi:hypothetical protein